MKTSPLEISDDAPILLRLGEELRAASNLNEYAIIRLKQGIYLIRTSNILEAEIIPTEIRQLTRGSETADVYIWLWLLEALVVFYKTGRTGGASFIERGLSLARVVGRSDLFEYLSAWRAQFSFVEDDFERVTMSLFDSNVDRSIIPEANCRGCLVKAGMLQSAGFDTAASFWFGRARDHARQIGDRATIMASIENRASLRLDNIWVKWGRGESYSDVVGQVEAELLGGLEYERITGSHALIDQASAMRIRLSILRENYASALLALNSIEPQNSSYSMVLGVASLRPWLCLRMGERGEHIEAMLDESVEYAKILDDDDALVVWRILRDVAVEIGRTEQAARFDSNFISSAMKYDQRISRLKRIVQSEAELYLN